MKVRDELAIEDERLKVALYHNIIAPYRIPLFRELGKNVDLKVFFGDTGAKTRSWKLIPLEFEHEILRGYGTWGMFSTFTPFLIPKLLFSKFDVYIGCDSNLFGTIITYLVSRLKGKPFILCTAEREYSTKKSRSRIRKIIYNSLKKIPLHVCNNADLIIALGQKTVDRLINIGVSEKKIRLGPNAYPIQPLRNDYEKAEIEVQKGFMRIPENNKIILSISYFRKEKGLDVLIYAFGHLIKKMPNVTLIIAGIGSYVETLKNIAKTEKIPVLFRGYVSEHVKAIYYKMADVFVLPSLGDTWGLTVNEAMICETPVITTEDAGAMDLIFDRRFLVKSGDPKALFEALKTMLDDDELRSKIGSESWKVIQGYSIEKLSKVFIESINYVSGEKHEP